MIESDILVPPAVEPVTLAEAKTWLKIDDNDDDLLIAGLISSARLTVEALTGLLLLTQTWRFRIELPINEKKVRLPHRPVLSLTGAQLRDRADIPHTLSLDGFTVSRGTAGLLHITDDRNFYTQNFLSLEIDAVMGFGPTSASVPSPLITAIQMLISFWHERRGDDPNGMVNPWPSTLTSLLQPYREKHL